jgi:hypothetical protein
MPPSCGTVAASRVPIKEEPLTPIAPELILLSHLRPLIGMIFCSSLYAHFWHLKVGQTHLPNAYEPNAGQHRAGGLFVSKRPVEGLSSDFEKPCLFLLSLSATNS